MIESLCYQGENQDDSVHALVKASWGGTVTLFYDLSLEQDFLVAHNSVHTYIYFLKRKNREKRWPTKPCLQMETLLKRAQTQKGKWGFTANWQLLAISKFLSFSKALTSMSYWKLNCSWNWLCNFIVNVKSRREM